MILDAEHMASWLSPHQHLRDGSHPNQRFAMDVCNVMLNMLRDYSIVAGGNGMERKQRQRNLLDGNKGGVEEGSLA